VAYGRALILSGGGDFTDPWHPFPATSARIADLLAEVGLNARVSTSVLSSLRDLANDPPELLVINAGNAERPSDGDAEAISSLSTYLRGGGALLVLHVSSTAFPGVDEWERIVGGRWVRGVSLHPDEGESRVRVVPGHPITTGLSDFSVFDEMYSWLRVDGGDHVLATHSYDGVDHPLAWAREVDGARVAYDALGHTTRSFDSADHVRLLQNSARWALREL
jgi:uncharacterized protein